MHIFEALKELHELLLGLLSKACQGDFLAKLISTGFENWIKNLKAIVLEELLQ